MSLTDLIKDATEAIQKYYKKMLVAATVSFMLTIAMEKIIEEKYLSSLTINQKVERSFYRKMPKVDCEKMTDKFDKELEKIVKENFKVCVADKDGKRVDMPDYLHIKIFDKKTYDSLFNNPVSRRIYGLFRYGYDTEGRGFYVPFLHCIIIREGKFVNVKNTIGHEITHAIVSIGQLNFTMHEGAADVGEGIWDRASFLGVSYLPEPEDLQKKEMKKNKELTRYDEAKKYEKCLTKFDLGIVERFKMFESCTPKQLEMIIDRQKNNKYLKQ